MSSASISVGDEPHRKKVRKGTFSCWECKRRKVRCVFGAESDGACTGCRRRGATCHSQKLVDEDVAATIASKSIPERVGQLESLMETCLQTLSEVRQSRQDGPVDILTPSSTTSHVRETAPVLSLFNNALFGQNKSNDDMPNEDSDSPKCHIVAIGGASLSEAEKTRQKLLALAPTHRQLQSLVQSTSNWWHTWQLTYPDICAKGESSSLAEFASQLYSESHIPTIANVLLCIAVSIQQLPSTFDFSSIRSCGSARSLIEEYISTISSLVAYDDEAMASIEGLECLALLGKLYLNDGKPRKAWLSFRRAMNLAEIIGIHRNAVRSVVGPDGISVSRKASVWWQIYQADRLLSLLLGFSRGLGDEFCDINVCNDKTEVAHLRKVAKIAGQVSDRNLTKGDPSFILTKELDEKLQVAATSMPRSWWSLPIVLPSTDEATLLLQIMPQFWHFQIELLLHLPFMLRASNEPQFEYNKQVCLRASRDMIDRFMFLRSAACASFKTCKMVEFQAFTAALVVQLNILNHAAKNSPREDLQQTLDDRETVDSVMAELANRPSDGTGVASQAVKVLEVLKAVARNDGSVGPRFKLKIPYFGTISVSMGTKLRQQNMVIPTVPGMASNDGIHYPLVGSHPQPDLPIPLMHDDFTSSGSSMPLPQVSFTSTLFTNHTGSTTQFPEDDWISQNWENAFETNRVDDLDGIWDWFEDGDYPTN